MISSSNHVVAKDRILFLVKAEEYAIVKMRDIFFSTYQWTHYGLYSSAVVRITSDVSRHRIVETYF